VDAPREALVHRSASGFGRATCPRSVGSIPRRDSPLLRAAGRESSASARFRQAGRWSSCPLTPPDPAGGALRAAGAPPTLAILAAHPHRTPQPAVCRASSSRGRNQPQPGPPHIPMRRRARIRRGSSGGRRGRPLWRTGSRARADSHLPVQRARSSLGTSRSGRRAALLPTAGAAQGPRGRQAAGGRPAHAAFEDRDPGAGRRPSARREFGRRVVTGPALGGILEQAPCPHSPPLRRSDGSRSTSDRGSCRGDPRWCWRNRATDRPATSSRSATRGAWDFPRRPWRRAAQRLDRFVLAGPPQVRRFCLAFGPVLLVHGHGDARPNCEAAVCGSQPDSSASSSSR